MPKNPAHAERIALIQAHASVFLGGAAGLFGKALDISPAAITCGRSVFGAVALAGVAIGLRAGLRPGGRRNLLRLAASGGLLAVHWWSFFRSIQVATVAVGLLTFATFPLWVTFLEPVFFGERLRRRDVATAGAVVAGLALVCPSFDAGDRVVQGVLWGLLAALSYAALTLLGRATVRVAPAITVAFYQQAGAAIVTLPMAWGAIGSLSGRDLGFLLMLGVALTALPQALLVASLRRLRARTASVLFGLEPGLRHPAGLAAAGRDPLGPHADWRRDHRRGRAGGVPSRRRVRGLTGDVVRESGGQVP